MGNIAINYFSMSKSFSKYLENINQRMLNVQFNVLKIDPDVDSEKKEG